MSCTLFPDGCWGKCCQDHDLAYRFQTGKIKADLALYKCVKNSGHRWIGSIMFIGVVLFGLPFYLKARFKKW